MDKIYFELEPVQYGTQNYFRARLQISDALRVIPNNENLTEKVAMIEDLYEKTIRECREIYRQIRTYKRGERLYRYWDIADKIMNFLRQTDQEGFFLNYPASHFARDLEVTSRTIDYLLAFRKQIADKNQLDPTKSLNYYTRRYCGA